MVTPRRVVVLSGAGLSAASGVPTFRGSDGLWEGHDVMSVATPEAWVRDADLVQRFYAERRAGVARVRPNPGHHALARLQAAWGDRVTLVTQNIDGLLTAAGCDPVLEMHGSLWEVQCGDDPSHPRQPIEAASAERVCAACGARMRPAVVWFGEIPRHLDAIERALVRSDLFLSVGTSGVVYPAAGFARAARRLGTHTVEINPEPSGGLFDEVIAEGSEVALPRLVDAWLRA